MTSYHPLITDDDTFYAELLDDILTGFDRLLTAEAAMDAADKEAER